MKPATASPRAQSVGLFVLVTAGVAISVAAYLGVHAQAVEDQQKGFDDLATARAEAVGRRASTAVDRVRAAAAYLATTQGVEQRDYAALRPGFRLFASELINGAPDLAGIAWVPHVAGNDRAAFLRLARPANVPPFDLTEITVGGGIAPEPARSDYFPVAIIFRPADPGAPAPTPLRGIDLGGDARLRARLAGALTHGRLIAEPAARALPRVTDGPAVMVLVPVALRPSLTDTTTTPAGFALGLVDVAHMVEEALQGLPQAEVDVTLFDVATQTPLYRLAAPNRRDDDYGADPLERTSTLTIGDLSWDLVVRTGPHYPRGAGFLASQLILLAGLLLTGGGAAYLRRSMAAAQRKAEADTERREAATNLKSIFDASLDAIVSADDYGRINRWNVGAERIFGWSSDDVVGSTLAETIIPVWDREQHNQALRSLRETGQSPLIGRLIEYRMARRDGTELPVELMMAPTRQGGVLTVTAFIRDITERKRAEKELRRSHAELEDRVKARTAELQEASERLAESEQHLRMMMENAGDAVYLSDEKGRILEANRRACAMLGYELEELLALHIWDIETKADPSRPVGPRLAALQPGEVITSQGEQRRKDGGSFPVEVRVGPIEIGDERAYLALARDVTERRAMEAALASARDAAIEASRLKSDFLANMSHEIRTPLNGILGMTGLLLDSELSASQREDLETLKQSADHLLTLINDILDLARIEAGRFYLESTPFDLETVMSGVGGLLAAAAERKGVEFIIRMAPNTPRMVVGDASRLRQVLLNLAGNAVKFTDKGHVLLEVECHRRTDKEATLRFAVTDTGIGIPAEDLDRVFEKFTQVDPSPKRRFGGTGLGLAISRQLVEAMGGRIEASSTPEVGSEFWFSLVLPLGEARAEQRATSLGRVRALVVDDNAVNRRILHEQLSSWRLRPTSVSTPGLALESLRNGVLDADPYLVAILDYQMDDMTGLELAHAIREDASTGTPLILLLSSVGRHFDNATVSAAGIARWLTKPVGPSELLDALTDAWEGHEAAHVAPADHGAISAKVLLAEDSPVNQRVAVRMLEKLGCRVEVAKSGTEAVALARHGGYDLVLMDCQMPEMDGYEATGRIRDIETASGRHTPIVALTAHAMAGDRERCLAAGMDDYLSKPVALHELAAVLRRYTGGDVESAPETTIDATGLVDGARLMGDLDHDTQLLGELARLFDQQAEVNLAGLRDAIVVGNASEVRRLGHALKGSMLTMRARGDQAAAMEIAGQEGDLARAATLVDPLTADARAVALELFALSKSMNHATGEGQ